MKTTEGNRLITEYMGIKPRLIAPDLYGYSDLPFFSVTEHSPEKVMDSILGYVKYHKEWNWLMPVVEKIQKTHIIEFHTYNGAKVYEKGLSRKEILSISSIPNPNVSNPPTPENPMFIPEFNNMMDLLYNLVIRFIKLQKP
jgi:hypothetical protein